MNTFLLDKEFSEQYEAYFAEVGGFEWFKTTSDDKGVDLYTIDMEIIIDVKCYATPKYVKHFTGAFLETHLPLSGRDGWLYDKTKKTTHYILLQDCSRESVNYFKGWYIARDDLIAAMRHAEANRELEAKAIASGEGYIIPYKYLDRYCIASWHGGKYDRNNQEIA